jgi:hypothetical protein
MKNVFGQWQLVSAYQFGCFKHCEKNVKRFFLIVQCCSTEITRRYFLLCVCVLTSVLAEKGEGRRRERERERERRRSDRCVTPKLRVGGVRVHTGTGGVVCKAST